MDETRAVSRGLSPRSARPAARWLRTHFAVVCAVGLGLMLG